MEHDTRFASVVFHGAYVSLPKEGTSGTLVTEMLGGPQTETVKEVLPIAMYEQYEKHKEIRRQLDKVKPGKRDLFEQRHHAELALYEAAVRYLEDLKAAGEPITPKKCRHEVETLAAKKDLQCQQMKAMWEEIKAVEDLRKAAEKLSKEQPDQTHKKSDHEL